MFDEDDFEEKMEEYRRKREEERLAKLKRLQDKITDPQTTYLGLAHIVADRFRITQAYPGSGYSDVVYILLNHYTEEVEEDFMTWLYRDDGPFVKSPRELLKIFPEFTTISDNAHEVMKMANSVYGLDLQYSSCEWHGDYIYSFQFSYDNFTPINIDEIVEVKREISFCEKYNLDTTALEKKLEGYGLTVEQLEKLDG